MAASLRFRTLFAGTAIAALALTGCAGGGGGDDSSGGEESAAPEAPTDYTTEQVESTLAASTVDGEELSNVTPAADAVGEDMSQEGISMMVGSQAPAVGPYQSLLGCLSLCAFRPRHLGRDVSSF